MDLAAENRPQIELNTSGVMINVELLLIAAIVLVSAALRLFSLGVPAMTDAEAFSALAAWRATIPDTAGSDLVASSPVLFWAQSLSFGLLGGSEMAARLLTAVAGVVLSVSPLLFRPILGQSRAWTMTVLLVFSPVVLGASRFSGPAVWASLFAVVMLWAFWRYWRDDSSSHGVLSIVFGALLVLFAEPGGLVLMITLFIAAMVGLAWAVSSAPVENDMPGDDFLNRVRGRLNGMPWGVGLLAAGLVVFSLATAFFLAPSGLNMVGAALQGFVDGWTTGIGDAPTAYPLSVTLFYEPWLIVLAMIALATMAWLRQMDFVDVFLLVWVIVALVMSAVYAGARADHALWLVLPLAGLVSHVVALALRHIEIPLMWMPELLDDDERRMRTAIWGKWLLAIIAFGLLLMAAMHFQIAARGFWLADDGRLTNYISRLSSDEFNVHFISLIWFLIAALFVLVGYFLASSIWGAVIPAQSLVLGFVGFMLLTSFGSGWRMVGTHANDPVEPWFVNGTSDHTALLRETLLDFSFRETGGFPEIPIVAVVPDDGVMAWLLRDFSNTRFVASIADAQNAPIVIVPLDRLNVDENGNPFLPELSGAYVGQDFVIETTWSNRWLSGFQFLAWWSGRLSQFNFLSPQPIILQDVVVWVRQDVYDSLPLNLEEFGN